MLSSFAFERLSPIISDENAKPNARNKRASQRRSGAKTEELSRAQALECLAKGVLNVLLFVVAPKNPIETDQQYLCQQQEAAKSPEAAQRFLLGRLPPGVSPQQPSAFHRLIDFTFRSLSKPSLESLVTHAFVTNLVHPSWLEKLLSSRGLFVEEGMSPGPFQVHLRRLKLVDEPGDWDDGPGKGVGVQVTSRYEVG
jgi:hypothetical protein